MNNTTGLELTETDYGVRRKWWVAVLLSLLLPGLGQLYNGQLIKGIILCSVLWMVDIVSLCLMWGISSAPSNIILALFIDLLVLILIIRDAILVSRRIDRNFKPKFYNKWYVYIVLILFFHLIFWPVMDNIFYDVHYVPSEAMSPTLVAGDRIVVDKFIYKFNDPTRGDIVTFRFPLNKNKLYVKRVMGMPGDTVEIVNKQLIINGTLLNEEYVVHMDSRVIYGRDSLAAIVVPEGKYYVMGDNRDNSYDSRFFGFVDRNEIISKVRTVLFSWDTEKKRLRWERFGTQLSP